MAQGVGWVVGEGVGWSGQVPFERRHKCRSSLVKICEAKVFREGGEQQGGRSEPDVFEEGETEWASVSLTEETLEA